MLRVLSKLAFILLITNFSYGNTDKSLLFVGHAYGSHNEIDNKIDPTLSNYLNSKIADSNFTIILGGDFIYDCNNKEEYQNLIELSKIFDLRFVVGNHDDCEGIVSLIQQKYGSTNYYEKINENILFYLNTTIDNNYSVDKLFDYVLSIIDKEKPNKVLIFTHQVIFSKNDFYLRVNSRKYYQFGNIFYKRLEENFMNKEIDFYFFSGDIGAFKYTPYAFYDSKNNFEYYAVGLGNKIHEKAISINVADDININFVDLESSQIENKKKYKKLKVQLYQFPKLFFYYLKSNFLVFMLIIIVLSFRLFKYLKNVQ